MHGAVMQACPVLPAPLTPGVTFIHVEGKEQRRGTSWSNPNQVQVAVQVVMLLLQQGASVKHSGNSSSRAVLTASSIGIIAPYKAAVHDVIHKLPPAASAIEVNTVDAFQVGAVLMMTNLTI